MLALYIIGLILCAVVFWALCGTISVALNIIDDDYITDDGRIACFLFGPFGLAALLVYFFLKYPLYRGITVLASLGEDFGNAVRSPEKKQKKHKNKKHEEGL